MLFLCIPSLVSREQTGRSFCASPPQKAVGSNEVASQPPSLQTRWPKCPLPFLIGHAFQPYHELCCLPPDTFWMLFCDMSYSRNTKKLQRKFQWNKGDSQILRNNISLALDQQYALYTVKVSCWLLLIGDCFFQLSVGNRIKEPLLFLIFVSGGTWDTETMRKVTFL